MNGFSLVTKSLLSMFIGLRLSAAQCDYIYFTQDNALCYGMRSNSSFDSCTELTNVGFIEAMARNPVTEDFYVVTTPNNTEGVQESGSATDRYIMRVSASLVDGTPVIDEMEQIGDVVLAADQTEQIDALAFTCQGVPRLFGLSTYQVSPQYLYEIDYETGNFSSPLLEFTITTFAGTGLFYNVDRDRLYRVGDSQTIGLYEIDPNDPSNNTQLIAGYTWGNNFDFGFTQFAAYYTESLFFTTNVGARIVFAASLDNDTFVDTDAADGRTGADGGVFVQGMECADYASMCLDRFSETPSTQPSGVPSTDPSTMPSGMPSSDPSSMPTEMPVEAMMTTEAEVMVDTTMEPESPEATEDSPEPTVADSASKNSIGFIMVFVAAFAYLF